jgi:hypothetical protein
LSAAEPIGTSFKMKFVQTENGEETSEVTDFPADLFYTDCDVDDVTSIHNSQFIIHNCGDVWFDLFGRKLNCKPSVPGIYYNEGKKIVITK